jgi:hypothetical protein
LFYAHIPWLERSTRLKLSPGGNQRAGIRVKTLSSNRAEPWRKRLHLPAYQVGEAARYARISTQTVVAWHKVAQRRVLSEKEDGQRLSYLQLIELAVVAGFRKAKIPLPEIRAAREYVKRNLKSEHPFAVRRARRINSSVTGSPFSPNSRKKRQAEKNY